MLLLTIWLQLQFYIAVAIDEHLDFWLGDIYYFQHLIFSPFFQANGGGSNCQIQFISNILYQSEVHLTKFRCNDFERKKLTKERIICCNKKTCEGDIWKKVISPWDTIMQMGWNSPRCFIKPLKLDYIPFFNFFHWSFIQALLRISVIWKVLKASLILQSQQYLWYKI